jgi:hypothetical protein
VPCTVRADVLEIGHFGLIGAHKSVHVVVDAWLTT